MKTLGKSLIFSMVLLSISESIHACDICGCRFGGYYFGVIPQYQSHFVGIRYNYGRFNAEVDNRYAEDEYSEDTFSHMELMGAYSLNDKLQFSFVLPYSWNKMDGNVQRAKINGIGDPSLLVLYNLINSADDMSKQWKHTLQIGSGLKFPLGEYREYDGDELLNSNFQLGTGSLDYLFTTNYVVRRNLAGIGLEATYKVNGKNKYDYRFGNQLSAGMNFFYWLGMGNAGLMPMAGLYFEQSAVHKDDTYTVDNTGGEVLMSNLGLQANVSQLTFNFSYQVPLYQNYNTDAISTIDSDARFWLGVILSFRIKKEYSFEINRDLSNQ